MATSSNPDFVATIQAKLESAQFLATAKRDFNAALKVAANFEGNVEKILGRLSAKQVVVDVDVKGDPVGAMRAIRAEIKQVSVEAQRAAQFDLPAAARAMREYESARNMAPARSPVGNMQMSRDATSARDQLRSAGVRIDLDSSIESQISKIAKQIDLLADTNPRFNLTAAIGSFETLSNAVKDFERDTKASVSGVDRALDSLRAAGVNVDLTGVKDTTTAVNVLHNAIEDAATEAHVLGSAFDLKAARADAAALAREIKAMEAAPGTMRASAAAIGANARPGSALSSSAAATDDTDDKLNRTQQRLLQLQEMLRQTNDIEVNIDVRAPNLSSFQTLGAALDKLEKDAKNIELGLDPNDVAAGVAQLRQANRALIGIAEGADVAEGELQQMRAAFAANERAAASAGRTAQQQLAKTSLASQSVIRIIQDAPFGMLGITNNIQQFSEEFGRLKNSMNPATGAMHTMGSAWKETAKGLIMGPMAIPFLITLITTLALSWDKVSAGIKKMGEWLGLTEAKMGDDLAEMKKGVEDFYKTLIKSLDANEMAGMVSSITSAMKQVSTAQDAASRTMAAYRAQTTAYNSAAGDGVAAAQLSAAAMRSLSSETVVTAAQYAAAQKESTLLAEANVGLKAAFEAMDAVMSASNGIRTAMAAMWQLRDATDAAKMAQIALTGIYEDSARRRARADAILNTAPGTAARTTALALADAADKTGAAFDKLQADLTAGALQYGVTVTRLYKSASGEIMYDYRYDHERFNDQQREGLQSLFGNLLTTYRAESNSFNQLAEEQGQTVQTRLDNRAAGAARTEANRQTALANAAAAAQRQRDAAADRARKAQDSIEQISADAGVRMVEEGYDARLAAIDAYVVRSTNALDNAADVLGEAAAAEARVLVRAAATASRAREAMSRHMVEIQNAASLATVNAAKDAASAMSFLTTTNTDPLAQARTALRVAEVEITQQRANLAGELVAVNAQMDLLEEAKTRLGANFPVEMQDQLDAADATRSRIIADQNAAEGAASVRRRTLMMAEIQVHRDMIDAMMDRNRAFQTFRVQTEEMNTALGGRQVQPGGVIGWLLAAGGEGGNELKTALANISAQLRGSLRDEESRWFEQSRSLSDRVDEMRAQMDAVVADALANGVQVDEAERAAAEARYTAAYNDRERAEKDHQDRITAIKAQALADQRDAEFAAMMRQVRMMQSVITNFSQASDTLYSTWSEQRSAELEREGVAEEERAEIMKREGRKRFLVMKGLRIAEAVSNTISAGVTAFRSGMDSGLPAPFNAILAGTMLASTLAVGFAQVNQLRNLQPDGSGGGSGGGSSVSMGGYTTLNGTVTADRVAAFEAGTGTLGGPNRSDVFGEAAARMEDAASRFESSASNLTATTTAPTAEALFDAAARRSASLNQ